MTTVLLLMDFQNGIVDRLGNDAVLARARRAADAARAKGLPVMFVRVAFRPTYPEVSKNNAAFGTLVARGDEMAQDAEATQISPALAPQPAEPIVLKRRVSAFTGSDLDVLLRAVGADSLVLAGIATSGVVLSTLRQAADLDYRLTVLADACADADDEVHRVLTGKVFPRQATVMATDEWVAGV